MRTINLITEDSYELYEICKENGWAACEYEDFDVLEFFEGDPDMIRVDGQIGYFWYNEENDTIYYYFDEWGHNIGSILRDFYKKRLHKEYWPDMQSWEYFDTHNCIAYRGGSGYVYSLFPLRIAS